MSTRVCKVHDLVLHLRMTLSCTCTSGGRGLAKRDLQRGPARVGALLRVRMMPYTPCYEKFLVKLSLNSARTRGPWMPSSFWCSWTVCWSACLCAIVCVCVCVRVCVCVCVCVCTYIHTYMHTLIFIHIRYHI